MNNPVRQALLERRLTIGSWIQIGHGAIAEILANAGFDWLAVDCEHSDIDLGQMTELFRGMYGRGAVPFVRVRENDVLAIRQALNLGAQGVIVPLVSTPEEAGRAVAAAKYPPAGIRGYCFSRMNNYGVDFDHYASNANDEIAVVVMIESRAAVENIEAILAVDGVDGVFIGPYDLSGSYDVPGQTSHPLVYEARQKVLEACAAAGKSAGLHLIIPDRAQIDQALADGFTFIALGADTVFLDRSCREALDVARGAATGEQ